MNCARNLIPILCSQHYNGLHGPNEQADTGCLSVLQFFFGPNFFDENVEKYTFLSLDLFMRKANIAVLWTFLHNDFVCA